MAGDWIKMRADLHTHPKVVRMASALKADRLRIVGGLHSAWCLFDVHSVDGLLDGYSADTLDDLIGFPGFSRAMMAVGWLDAVQADLENADYAFAGFDLCAAGFGAPHIRQRLFWVADADSEFMETPIERGQGGRIELADSGSLIGVDYAKCERRNTGRNRDYSGYVRQQSGAISEAGRLADTNSNGRERRLSGWESSKREVINGSAGCDSAARGTNAVNGFWGSADWIFCRDGKWRPVKPGISPLVDGVAGRVGQLRAYGNAIVAPVAEAFIAAYLDCAQ